MRGKEKDKYANETPQEYYNRVRQAKLNKEEWAKDIYCDPNIALAESGKVKHMVGPKNEAQYQEFLKHHPVTSAILAYAEEHEIMHWQVNDIIKRMRSEGIDVRKIDTISMVEELTEKMKVNLDA